MSEQAKPVCVSCGMPIIGKPRAVGHASDGVIHSTELECVMAVRREIAALRAALDQERADNAKLRAFAQDCEALWLNGGVSVLSLGDMLQRHKLIAGPTGNPTTLLSGRGEVSGG